VIFSLRNLFTHNNEHVRLIPFQIISTYFLSHNTIKSTSQTIFFVPTEQAQYVTHRGFNLCSPNDDSMSSTNIKENVGYSADHLSPKG
jgi:hypothetical protein